MSKGISSDRRIQALQGLVVGVLAVGVLAGCGEDTGPAGSSGGAGASCVAPVTTVTPTSVSAGGSVEVHGRFYTQGCGDVVEAEGKKPSATAMKDVPVVLSASGGSSTEIARLNASGTLGLIDGSVTIPDTVAAGTITLQLGDAQPVTLSVTAK